MKIYKVALLSILLSLSTIAAAFAGGVNVAPTRLVLESGARAGAFTLYNDDPSGEVSYRIGFADLYMTPDGLLRPLEEGAKPPAGWRSAHDLLQVSPTQVRLGPGRSQTVRVAVRAPEDIAPGEYRIHLAISALPAITAPTPVSAPRQFSVSLASIYTASVPVIVRFGGVRADAVVDAPRFEPRAAAGGPALVFDLKRIGDASVAGDVAVFYAAPNAKPEEVGQVRKIAVYTEVTGRRVSIPLKAPAGGFRPGATLTANFYPDLERPSPPLASASTIIP